MNKKHYEKPTMQIVQLQQQCHILSGSSSSVGAVRSGYGAATEDNWE